TPWQSCGRSTWNWVGLGYLTNTPRVDKVGGMKTLTAEERARERAMILNPYEWPHMFLPLKRRKDVGFPDCALLRTAITEADYLIAQELRKPTELIVDVNACIWGPIGPVERVFYKDVDALLDDGWVVD